MEQMEKSLKDKYNKDGFVVIENYVDQESVQLLYKQLTYPFSLMCSKNEIDFDNSADAAIINLYERNYDDFYGATRQLANNPNLHKLGLRPELLEILKILGISEPYICGLPMVVYNCKKLAREEYHHRTPIHQDLRSMQGSQDSVVVWMPLVDVDELNGAIQAISGSHMNGLYDTVKDNWYRRIPEELVNLEEFQSVNMKAGDLLIFSSLLVHRSGLNVTGRLRWACQFRYNNLIEMSFIERGLYNPYVHRPEASLKFKI